MPKASLQFPTGSVELHDYVWLQFSVAGVALPNPHHTVHGR
jgi:hypothetical protein